jgi:hypothetical protein
MYQGCIISFCLYLFKTYIMKKLIYIFLTVFIVGCSGDLNQVHIDKIKQQVKESAMGIDLNYKNVNFKWVDTLTVKKQSTLLISSYDIGVSTILTSPYFSKDKLTKKEFISLRNWENGIRNSPFISGDKKYKNYEEFIFSNREMSSFIADLCNQIEISDKLIKNWDSLEDGNLELIKNSNWYYKRQASYNGTSEDFFNSITTIVKALEEVQTEIDSLSDLNPNDIIEVKASNNYKINNPLLNGAEQELTKYFIFDKDYNIIRTESVD